MARARLSSLRTTFTVSFAAVAAAVTVLVGFLSYDAAARLVRVDQQTVFEGVVQDLLSEVRHSALSPADFATADTDGGPRDELIRPSGTVVQVLGPDRSVVDRGHPPLPVDADDKRIAAARTAGRLVEHRDVDVGDDVYRVATVSLGDGRGAVQIAQEFSDTEDLLRELQQRTVLLEGAVVIAAGLFGWWLARRITSRLVRLAGAAEDVARTGRLGIQVPVAGYDEVARLGRSFDRMLGRLAQSEEDQRRLVQDAGHELRTPLTSLRTNISMLRRIDELPPAVRAELVADLAQESRELTDLVNELVDLAAGQSDREPPQRVALADIAEEVAVAARRRTGRAVTVRVSGDTVVDGRPGALQRALSNLVDNAAKFDRGGSAPIDIVLTGAGAAAAAGEGEGAVVRTGVGVGAAGVAVGAGAGADAATRARADAATGVGAGTSAGAGVRVEVLDRGPGIAEEDLERVFDRFYRAPDARSLPGSGLGLSIVREVAAAHGGWPFARRREGGGSAIGFTVGRG
ncbi:HAMP domain-containing sensor histidine kinase [Streptomyces sp. NBC_00878]|uniref:sensor histidine kinase n=1 Tax=Streptomyces sp. NBC_00878 TaxID=2975854 RepID=UPI002258C39B|nr:HAMP domain-containing sensor histidine kinase [Streptomyces sp. NBC_00878]MCX4907878.1 HAMP domain-containing histidine kinase [Streptomyces sp. NBC_00878]